MDQDTVDTAVALRRGLTNLNRRLRLETRVLGLSGAKLSILGQLYRHGPKTPKALALNEGVQPQSLTRVLAELEEARLILRTQDESDRRQYKLEITPEGRERLIQDARKRALWLASAMDGSLTALEIDLLRLSITLLDKLTDYPPLNKEDGTMAGA